MEREQLIQELRDWVAEFERWEGKGSHISTTGEHNTPVRLSLYAYHLRAALDSLDAATGRVGLA